MTLAAAHKGLCQAVSGPKIDYWIGTPTLFPWFSFEWPLPVSKNKACHKGTNISGYWKHPKNVWTALEAVPQQKFQKCF